MEWPEYDRSFLSVFDLCAQGTRVLGPGLRYAIWTQGCPFRCEGCATPNSRPFLRDKQVRIEDLGADILSRPYIEGITISGGEPFLQAASLADLLEMVLSKRPDLTVMAFSGFVLESLCWDDATRLLQYLDVLIDGPYVQKLNDDHGLRGSSNQRILFLTPRLLPWKEEMEQCKRKMEFHVVENTIKAFGIPSTEMTQMLSHGLKD